MNIFFHLFDCNNNFYEKWLDHWTACLGINTTARTGWISAWKKLVNGIFNKKLYFNSLLYILNPFDESINRIFLADDSFCSSDVSVGIKELLSELKLDVSHIFNITMAQLRSSILGIGWGRLSINTTEGLEYP